MAFPGHGRAALALLLPRVSLMPEQLMKDLELEVELRSRTMASYTPYFRDGRAGGLLVERPEGEATRASFRELTGGDDEYAAWRSSTPTSRELAAAVAPTLLEPLPTEAVDRARGRSRACGARSCASRSVRSIERRFTRRPGPRRGRHRRPDRHLRRPARASLVQNRAFLYHLIGNGTGEWRVPVGGMGAVTDALLAAAVRAGAEVVTGAGVSRIAADGDGAEVTWHDGTRSHTVHCAARARERRAVGAADPARRASPTRRRSRRAPSSRSTSCSTGCRR